MDKSLLRSRLSKYFDDQTLAELNFEDLQKKKDIISSIFENLKDQEKRKKLGQFFTHKEIVLYILDNIPLNKDSTVLDPACGVGAFLSELKNRGHDLKNIFGIDIDPMAIDLCSLNLGISPKENNNLVEADTINESGLENFFPQIKNAGGFDIIVGNPPFINMKRRIDFKDQKIYSNFIEGVANSATLMIAKSYYLLKEGGYLGFVLPKNVLRVASFGKLRNFLVNNTRLVTICDLDHYFKDVRGDQIIIIFQKLRLNEEEKKRNKIKIAISKKNQSFDKPYLYEIDQKSFSEFDCYPVFYNEKIFEIARKLLGIKNNLDSTCNGEIFRGLGISSSNPALSKELLQEKVIAYRGDSIVRFGIKYPLYLDFLKLNKIDKRRVKRLSRKKIIIQNIMSREGGVFANITDEKTMTLDTVTNIIPPERYQKYILGVLNSKLSNFFMIFIVFLHSNFTMHTDREYIGKLPIVIPNEKEEGEVINIVDNLLGIEDKYSLRFIDEYAKLNKKLYEIYLLNTEEVKTIERCLKEVLSVKQYGRFDE